MGYVILNKDTGEQVAFAQDVNLAVDTLDFYEKKGINCEIRCGNYEV